MRPHLPTTSDKQPNNLSLTFSRHDDLWSTRPWESARQDKEGRGSDSQDRMDQKDRVDASKGGLRKSIRGCNNKRGRRLFAGLVEELERYR